MCLFLIIVLNPSHFYHVYVYYQIQIKKAFHILFDWNIVKPLPCSVIFTYLYFVK